MELARIRELKQQIIDEDGPWTAHNFHLSGGEFTISPKVSTIELRAKRYLQIVSDLAKRPLSELRILDLGSCEGLYSIEFGMQGCEVVGVEGRTVHIRKAEFARDALGLNHVSFRQGDVRQVLQEDLGKFDVTICAGLFYHLAQEDLLPLLRTLKSITTQFVIVETHVPFSNTYRFDVEGKTYHGVEFTEHPEASSADEKLANVWASMDNAKSFWPSKASLFNMLMDCNYTSVLEAHVPVTYDPADRITLLAFCGTKSVLKSAPPFLNSSQEFAPEIETKQSTINEPAAGLFARLKRRLVLVFQPKPVKPV